MDNIGVKKSLLERSIEYLACPRDYAELTLDIPNKDTILEGEYKCKACGTSYPIIRGVPYFFEKGKGYEWPSRISQREISESVAETVEDSDLTWSKIKAVGWQFLYGYGTRKEAIDRIFRVAENAIALSGAVGVDAAFVMQSATAARYDIDSYRGTFTLRQGILSAIERNYDSSGIVVEGASATGDCISRLSEIFKSPFYFGFDISASMAGYAQRYNGSNCLFAQGNICNPPLKKDVAGLYVLNNVFDRVMDPIEASMQADRIVRRENGLFVLSNCDPLQYGYTTADGTKISFVPLDKQISLEQGLGTADFRELAADKGIWNITTIAYGEENLPYKSLLGGR
jgi:uncharacterized protein YbaR (Trm112 family)